MPLRPGPRRSRLQYEVFGDDDAPVVVLIRGTGADGTRWMPQVEAYRDEFRVVIFDNRGVGASDTPPGPYTVADMAADTVGLLDALDIDRCHLSGSSLGGAIASTSRSSIPSGSRACSCTPVGWRRDGYTAYSLGLLKQLPRHRWHRLLLRGDAAAAVQPRFMSTEHERLMAMLAHMKAHPATYEGLLGQIEANLSHDLRAARRRGRRRRRSSPSGSSTTSCRWRASEELQRAIPNSELIVFPGGPHLVTMESPERFNDVTLTWLRKVVADA